MNLDEVLKYFKEHYPDASITKLPEDSPMELICEIDPASAHAEYSVGIAAINSSEPHFHVEAEEEYEILSGTLLVKIGDKVKTMYENEKIVIEAREVHSATSITGFALVKVTSKPGWTQEDHLLAPVI